MIDRIFRASAALALLTVAACASVADGVSQNITVTTDPEGAKCDLVREGKSIGIVNPTPGTINVDKDADDITITCERDEHLATNTTITSKFTGATFGNIILGGGIGILIDAASGANNRYPERVDVIMTPVAFRSEAERDAHFGKIRAKLQKQADETKKAIAKECEGELSGSAHCESGPAEIDKQLKAELQRLDAERAQVVIDPDGKTAAREPEPAVQPDVAKVQQQAPAQAAPAAIVTRTSGNPTCAEQARQAGLAPGTFGCVMILKTGSYDLGRSCESTYNKPATAQFFRKGDELLTDTREYRGTDLPGFTDARCFRTIQGTWAISASDPNIFFITEGYDKNVAWCQGAECQG